MSSSSSSSSASGALGGAGIFPPPSGSRLVTICAHVDHGKTTLADNLVAHNGIISERLAGTLRYLDSDPEEQRRGITMRASAVGIRHKYVPPKGKKKKKDHEGQDDGHHQQYIVHLVDSPGHADFRQEVTSSLTACDVAIIVLDVVEGMGARTHQVLRETHAHSLSPLLVLNKVDRLCTELCLTPSEAYLRIRNLLETVNAAASAILTAAENMTTTTAAAADDDDTDNDNQQQQQQQQRRQQQLEEQERAWTFDPATNVLFASALHGFGFTTTSVARSLYRSKLVDVKPGLLKQFMFGDYRYRSSDGKVVKWRHDDEEHGGGACMFAEFALKPIWDVYQGVAGVAAAAVSSSSANGERSSMAATMSSVPGIADQIVRALHVAPGDDSGTGKVETADDLVALLSDAGAKTEQAVLRCILRQYRNLSTTLLDLVCDASPSPVDAQSPQSLRAGVLQLQEPTSPRQQEGCGDEGEGEFRKLKQAVADCDPSAPWCVAHVSKFIVTDVSHIRDPELYQQQQQGGGHKRNELLGLVRVLCGKLRTGQSYYCMGPKHKYGKVAAQREVRLYVVMGSSFVLVDEVPAGHLCAVSNVHDLQLKTLTLCDSPSGMPLRGFDFTKVRPLLKVNIEPENAADADLLETGLMKLSLADAAVEVTATAKGERILACLGELHLEQSIHDLRTVYCGDESIKLRISDPICDFGESTDWFENELDYNSFYDDNSPPLRQMTIPPYNEEEGLSYARRGRVRSVLTGRVAAIQLRVVPLSREIYKALERRRVPDDEGSDCVEELYKLGRALKIGSAGANATAGHAELVLSTLCDCLRSLGSSNGNALVETPALRDGFSVRAVVGSEEVYVPPARSDQKAEKKAEIANSGEDGDADAEVSMSSAAAQSIYMDLQDCIRQVGFQSPSSDEAQQQRTKADDAAFRIWKEDMKGSAGLGGLQMALRAGPICEEPVRNVLVLLEGIEIVLHEKNGTGTEDKIEGGHWYPPKQLSGGMVVSALRIGIRCALLSRPVRLMEGMLRLTLHSSLSGLGPLYSILSKRRGRVLEESMVDDGTTDLLSITALIPQAEAFGLTSELLSKTRGHATAPEMIFGDWERLEVDPFWIPTTVEEKEDYGDVLVGDTSTGIDNPALRYIRQVRQRKGLKVDSSRTVIAAEKQRTLKR